MLPTHPASCWPLGAHCKYWDQELSPGYAGSSPYDPTANINVSAWLIYQASAEVGSMAVSDPTCCWHDIKLQKGMEESNQVIGKSDLKNIMEQHDLKPSKSLGQNFVVDPNTILKVIRAANIEKHQQILEIGPGLGSLIVTTICYLKVVAIELDHWPHSHLKKC